MIPRYPSTSRVDYGAGIQCVATEAPPPLPRRRSVSVASSPAQARDGSETAAVEASGLVAAAAVGDARRSRRLVSGIPAQSQELTEKDTIVVADFNNTTGEPVFDAALKQALTVDLEQSPFLNVLSDQKVNEQLALHGRSPDTPLTEDIARQVCQRTGSKAMLLGSISALGSHYVHRTEGHQLPHRRLAGERAGRG